MFGRRAATRPRPNAYADPAGETLSVATIRGVPLYDGDVEAAERIPGVATALKDQIAAADGLLLVTPEYSRSLPGVFTNAIDWLTRPPADIRWVFGGKLVAVIGASLGGRFGTILDPNAWLPVLMSKVGTEPWFGDRLMVSRAHVAFDGNGTLVDTAVEGQLRKSLAGFVGFVRSRHR